MEIIENFWKNANKKQNRPKRAVTTECYSINERAVSRE